MSGRLVKSRLMLATLACLPICNWFELGMDLAADKSQFISVQDCNILLLNSVLILKWIFLLCNSSVKSVMSIFMPRYSTFRGPLSFKIFGIKMKINSVSNFKIEKLLSLYGFSLVTLVFIIFVDHLVEKS